MSYTWNVLHYYHQWRPLIWRGLRNGSYRANQTCMKCLWDVQNVLHNYNDWLTTKSVSFHKHYLTTPLLNKLTTCKLAHLRRVFCSNRCLVINRRSCLIDVKQGLSDLWRSRRSKQQLPNSADEAIISTSLDPCRNFWFHIKRRFQNPFLMPFPVICDTFISIDVCRDYRCFLIFGITLNSPSLKNDLFKETPI